MNQCPYCNFESEDDYCPNDSTRMVLLQPKPKATLKSNFESLFKTFSKHSDVLPVEIAEKFELSKTPVEHKLGYDIWQLEPKDKDAAEHNSTFIFIRYKSDRITTANTYRLLTKPNSVLPNVVSFGVMPLGGSTAQYELLARPVTLEPSQSLSQYFLSTQPSEQRALYVLDLIKSFLRQCLETQIMPALLDPEHLTLLNEQLHLNLGGTAVEVETHAYNRVLTHSLLTARVYAPPELSCEGLLTEKAVVYSAGQIVAEALFGKPFHLSEIQTGSINFDVIESEVLRNILKASLWHLLDERWDLQSFLSTTEDNKTSIPTWEKLHRNASSAIFFFAGKPYWRLDELIASVRSAPQHWDELVAQLDKIFEWASTSRFASMIQTLMTNKKLAGLSNERLLLELILVLYPDSIFFRNVDLSEEAAATNLQFLAQSYLNADVDERANIESQLDLLINR